MNIQQLAKHWHKQLSDLWREMHKAESPQERASKYEDWNITYLKYEQAMDKAIAEEVL